MSSSIRADLPGVALIGQAKVTINTATTTNFDFGTPDDLNLAGAGSTYKPGDRVMVILSASTAGTTDSITWSIQDAPDSAGAIGTPAAAVLRAITGGLAAGTSDDRSVFALTIQAGRPWLRARVTSTGVTDTFVCHATVLSIPSNA